VLKILAGIPDECVKKLPSLTEHDIGQIEQEVTLATAPLAADEPKKGE
jgi:phage terminase Nu1 subunit (DNA packaging protein)